MFSEVAETVGVAQLQFQQLLKTRVITYKNIPTLPNIYHLLTESEVITEKSQTEALMY